MTQNQIKELFGVSPSTLKDWKSKPNHTKKNLALYIEGLNYKEAVIKVFQLQNIRFNSIMQKGNLSVEGIGKDSVGNYYLYGVDINSGKNDYCEINEEKVKELRADYPKLFI